jgi:Spy/CpxP family protein refolding chaperone
MRGHRRGHGEFALARLANDPAMREKLGLTAEQTAKINQQTSEYRKARIRGRADLAVKRVELEDLLRAESPDRAAIDRKLDELSAARLVQTKAAVHYRLAMRDVLTPEQRAKLREMREEHRRGGFRDPREEGPRGPRPSGPGEE